MNDIYEKNTMERLIKILLDTHNLSYDQWHQLGKGANYFAMHKANKWSVGNAQSAESKLAFIEWIEVGKTKQYFATKEVLNQQMKETGASGDAEEIAAQFVEDRKRHPIVKEKFPCHHTDEELIRIGTPPVGGKVMTSCGCAITYISEKEYEAQKAKKVATEAGTAEKLAQLEARNAELEAKNAKLVEKLAEVVRAGTGKDYATRFAEASKIPNRMERLDALAKIIKEQQEDREHNALIETSTSSGKDFATRWANASKIKGRVERLDTLAKLVKERQDEQNAPSQASGIVFPPLGTRVVSAGDGYNVTILSEEDRNAKRAKKQAEDDERYLCDDVETLMRASLPYWRWEFLGVKMSFFKFHVLGDPVVGKSITAFGKSVYDKWSQEGRARGWFEASEIRMMFHGVACPPEILSQIAEEAKIGEPAIFEIARDKIATLFTSAMVSFNDWERLGCDLGFFKKFERNLLREENTYSNYGMRAFNQWVAIGKAGNYFVVRSIAPRMNMSIEKALEQLGKTDEVMKLLAKKAVPVASSSAPVEIKIQTPCISGATTSASATTSTTSTSATTSTTSTTSTSATGKSKVSQIGGQIATWWQADMSSVERNAIMPCIEKDMEESDYHFKEMLSKTARSMYYDYRDADLAEYKGVNASIDLFGAQVPFREWCYLGATKYFEIYDTYWKSTAMSHQSKEYKKWKEIGDAENYFEDMECGRTPTDTDGVMILGEYDHAPMNVADLGISDPVVSDRKPRLSAIEKECVMARYHKNLFGLPPPDYDNWLDLGIQLGFFEKHEYDKTHKDGSPLVELADAYRKWVEIGDVCKYFLARANAPSKASFRDVGELARNALILLQSEITDQLAGLKERAEKPAGNLLLELIALLDGEKKISYDQWHYLGTITKFFQHCRRGTAELDRKLTQYGLSVYNKWHRVGETLGYFDSFAESHSISQARSEICRRLVKLQEKPSGGTDETEKRMRIAFDLLFGDAISFAKWRAIGQMTPFRGMHEIKTDPDSSADLSEYARKVYKKWCEVGEANKYFEQLGQRVMLD